MYSADDVDIITFKSIPSDSTRFLSLKQWILSMTDEQDDEHGPDYWAWLAYNHELTKSDPMNLLNTFVAFLRNETNCVVATSSIVMDDQDMGKRLHLNEAVWIGGINVHRAFRGRRLGTILFASMDKHIQKTSSSRNTIVCLFTNNSGAKKIYRQYGFRSRGFIQNNALKTQDETVGAGTHETNPDDRFFAS
jgi:ribosomal protein S18 acetylase RimI-like enzyme